MKTAEIFLISILLFSISKQSLAQSLRISGKVYELESRIPLQGAIVTLVTSNITTSTGNTGEYSFINLSTVGELR